MSEASKVDNVSTEDFNEHMVGVRNKLRDDSYKIVHEILPKKVLHLNDLINVKENVLISIIFFSFFVITQKNKLFQLELSQLQTTPIKRKPIVTEDEKLPKKRKLEDDATQEGSTTEIPSNKVIRKLFFFQFHKYWFD